MQQHSVNQDLVTVMIAEQWFGIPVALVEDVLGSQIITPVPLAPPEVAGVLNLRGRVVTAIDVRRRLGLSGNADSDPGMSVVVECDGEPFSLMIDRVGEVLSLNPQNYEPNPPTLDPCWRDISAGIYRLDDFLLILLDVGKLLDFRADIAA